MAVSPVLDHVVINTRGRFDEAAGIYGRLGFALTALGRHTLGSINRLAVFDGEYLELLGIDLEAAKPRAELLRTPMGLEGLVFATPDAAALHRELSEQAAPVEPPLAFSRPVSLPHGRSEARFRVVRVTPEAVPYGRVYFCEHLTRELVWREEWRRHANGVHSIRRVVIATPEPEHAAELYRRLFGASAVVPLVGGLSLAMGGAQLDLLSPAQAAVELGEMPDRVGMVALTLATSSLDVVRRVLDAADVRPAINVAHRIVVHAASAFGVILEFVEAPHAAA